MSQADTPSKVCRCPSCSRLFDVWTKKLVDAKSEVKIVENVGSDICVECGRSLWSENSWIKKEF